MICHWRELEKEEEEEAEPEKLKKGEGEKKRKSKRISELSSKFEGARIIILTLEGPV